MTSTRKVYTEFTRNNKCHSYGLPLEGMCNWLFLKLWGSFTHCGLEQCSGQFQTIVLGNKWQRQKVISLGQRTLFALQWGVASVIQFLLPALLRAGGGDVWPVGKCQNVTVPPSVAECLNAVPLLICYLLVVNCLCSGGVCTVVQAVPSHKLHHFTTKSHILFWFVCVWLRPLSLSLKESILASNGPKCKVMNIIQYMVQHEHIGLNNGG